MSRSVLIVEDEATIALDIEMRLQTLGFEVCGIVHKPNYVINAVEKYKPAIILMDVNLNGHDEGISLAEEIVNGYHLPVVFLSAFTDSITFEKANEAGSYGFLTKPFKDPDLRNCIELAIKKHDQLLAARKRISDLNKKLYEIEGDRQIKNSIFLKDGTGYVNIKLSEILYIKAEDVYSKVITMESQLLVNTMLGDLLTRLPGSQFIRIHRSYIVSLDHVQKVTNDDVIIDGEELPISKSYKKMLLDQIN